MRFFLAAALALILAFGEKIKDNEIILLPLEEVRILPNYMIPIDEIYKNEPCKGAISKFVGRTNNANEESAECGDIWNIYSDTKNSFFNVLLVKNPKFNLLIDVGSVSSIGKLKTALADYDLSPKDITHIALSNAFSSHIGGLGNISKTFPNATLLLSEIEQKYWEQNGDELTKKRLKLYKNKAYFNGSWNFLDDSNITTLAMPGKTPGFTIFKFSDELYYVADMIYSYLLEDKYPGIANIYDIDKVAALESRLEFYKMVLEYEKNNPGKKVKILGTYMNTDSKELNIDETRLKVLEQKIADIRNAKSVFLESKNRKSPPLFGR